MRVSSGRLRAEHLLVEVVDALEQFRLVQNFLWEYLSTWYKARRCLAQAPQILVGQRSEILVDLHQDLSKELTPSHPPYFRYFDVEQRRELFYRVFGQASGVNSCTIE